MKGDWGEGGSEGVEVAGATFNHQLAAAACLRRQMAAAPSAKCEGSAYGREGQAWLNWQLQGRGMMAEADFTPMPSFGMGGG